MQEHLQLTDEQAEQFEAIRAAHFERTRHLHDDMHHLRLQLLDEIFTAQPDQNIIDALTAEIGQLQSQFERNLYTHFEELKNACTDEQAHKLKGTFADLLENTRPGAPRHRPPGPMHGPMHGPGPRGPGHPLPPPR